MFITFEGGEGSGKTTCIKKVVKTLKEQGHVVVLTREPGGTPISEEIRNVILDKKNVDMDPRTEALLYAASRRQHIVQKILPSLKEGKIVISDRFLDSSLAYQGGARKLGIDEILHVNMYATEGLEPDITFFFDIEPEEGLKRIAANAGREVNRLDVEKLSFHYEVRKYFQELTKRFSKRFVVIDASKDAEHVYQEVIKEIEKRLSK